MTKPRLLDLFCSAGGATRGYQLAGFYVVGVDINPQPRYVGDEFVQADAMTVDLGSFGVDAIHASPPCQDHMRTPHPVTHGTGWMLPATRDRLNETGLPWVIENVPGAPMRADFRICGCQVGLELRRERWFETNWSDVLRLDRPHLHEGPVVSVVGHGTPSWVREHLGYNPTIQQYREAMGIDWMNRNELSQAIPPAYTNLIGTQLMAAIRTGNEGVEGTQN